jgi:hypothetical protein
MTAMTAMGSRVPVFGKPGKKAFAPRIRAVYGSKKGRVARKEATPWGIEGEHDSWLRRVAGRLPPSLNAGGTQGAGFFKAADEGQIRSAKRA